MAASAKAKAWRNFVNKNVIISPPLDRIQTPDAASTSFCVTAKSIDGFPVKAESLVDFQVKINLYDITYKQFFGRTWIGETVQAKVTAGQQRVKLTFNQNVYFHTSLNDANIVAVFEIIGSGVKNGEPLRTSCGWGILPIFKFEEMQDVSESTAPSAKRLDIYHGSPRALVFLEDQVENNPNLSRIPECQLSYTICTHKNLRRIEHLLPENTLVGKQDIISGVSEAKEAGSDNLRKPRLVRKFACHLEKVALTLAPSVDKFEEDLCKILNEDRINRENMVADGSGVNVIERRLTIGVHNGWCYVDKPGTFHLNPDSGGTSGRRGKRTSFMGHQRTPSASSLGSIGANSLVLKNRVELDAMVEDPMMAVIFMLEYVIGEPIASQEKKLAMSRTQSHNVTVGWGVWSPFTSQSNEVSIQLFGGAMPNPEGVMVFKTPLPAETQDGTGHSPATITFTFLSDKQVSSSAGEQSLQIPMFQNKSASLTSLHTEGSIVDATHADAQGKPPLPGIGKARGMPGTTPTQMNGFRGQITPDLYAQNMMYGGYPITPRTPHGFMAGTPSGYYPMEITHLQEPLSPHVADLHELPFTPVHAPIMAVPHGRHSGMGLSRSAYAKLYSAGFPVIVDRHSEAPEVVDPSDQMNFIEGKEEADHLQCNEIILQFLAVAKFFEADGSTSSNHHGTVFFTFQFYRFPQVTSERLMLGKMEGELSSDQLSMPCLLQKLGNDGSLLKGPPGYQVKYHIDPAFLKPGEGRLFTQHLAHSTLHIDVWDGDSLLLIGSCAVELKHLCRQSREAVQVTYELDVVSSEHTESEGGINAGDLTHDGAVRPVDTRTYLRGRLHLRMANIGHPVDRKAQMSDTMPLPPKPKLVVAEGAGSSLFSGGSLTTPDSGKVKNMMSKTEVLGKTKVCKAQHVVQTNRELASVLFTRRDKTLQDETNRESDSVRNRKVARMLAVRQKEGQENQNIMSYRMEKSERIRDMKTIEHYRHETKRDGILNMLNSAITTEHTIHPALGSTEFFEFVLKNPYNTEATVIIDCDDPELSVITDAREWRHFKMIYNLHTSVEEGMFNTEVQTTYPQIFLRPKESVNVPFKYLTFRANHNVHQQEPASATRSQTAKAFYDKNREDPLQTRVLKVRFSTTENKPISILSLKVEPQPHIIDQTFRFYHPEQSFLKKSIRLPPLHTFPGIPVGGAAMRQLYVRCSDANVICETRPVQQGEPHDVFLKVACGASPQIKKFFVSIYTDPFLSKPIHIWQLYVHAMQRVDVACVEGQTSRFTLILRGTQSSRLVRCYSSHPREMQLHPNEAFMLTANALHEVHVGVRPAQVGIKFFYVNVVDVEYHQLLRSWLVCVTCRAPMISKAFELSLPVGGGKGSNKRIAYTNPYPHSRIFHIRSNHDSLVQFKENRMEMGPGETKNIGMRFAPCQSPGTTEILVFINDEDDKNEETFCVRATYSYQ